MPYRLITPYRKSFGRKAVPCYTTPNFRICCLGIRATARVRLGRYIEGCFTLPSNDKKKGPGENASLAPREDTKGDTSVIRE